MRLERWWPRWLCWMLGHEPTEHFRDDKDTLCCRCRTFEATRLWTYIYLRDRSGKLSWWTRLVGRLP